MYAVESSSHLASVSEQSIACNNLSRECKVMTKDARHLLTEAKADGTPADVERSVDILVLEVRGRSCALLPSLFPAEKCVRHTHTATLEMPKQPQFLLGHTHRLCDTVFRCSCGTRHVNLDAQKW